MYPVVLNGFKELWLQGPCHSWTYFGSVDCLHYREHTIPTWKFIPTCRRCLKPLCMAIAKFFLLRSLDAFFFFLYKFFCLGEKEVLLLGLKWTHSKMPSLYIFVRFYLNLVPIPCIHEGACSNQKNGRSCCKCMSWY